MIQVLLSSYVLKEGEKKYQVEHNLGWQLLSQGLRKLYGISICDEELSQMIGEGKHGKPYLISYPKIHFNISHSDGLVVCAFSDCPVGIDLERIDQVSESLVKKVLTTKEQICLKKHMEKGITYEEYFYRFWTLKESYLKWKGKGFFQDPKSVTFQIEVDQGKETASITCSDNKVCFYQKKISEDIILSICSKKRGEIPFSIGLL